MCFTLAEMNYFNPSFIVCRTLVFVVAFAFTACKSEPEIIKKSFSLEQHIRGAEFKMDRISIILEGLLCENENSGSVTVFDSEAMDSGPYGLVIQMGGTSSPARDGSPEIATNYWSGGTEGQRGVIKIGIHEIVLSMKGSLLTINGDEFVIKEDEDFAFLVSEDDKTKVTVLPSNG